ncbi:MAG: immunoglobulin-like domain-containing protein [Candidatus Woesearchaeota archaeon]
MIPEKIISEILAEHTIGASITDIEKISGISRSTIRTSLARLEGANLIKLRKIGMAKVYTLNQNLKNTPEEKNDSHKKSNHNTNGQGIKFLPIIVIVIAILLMLCPNPTTATTLEVSPPEYITNNEDYDVSPTLIYDGQYYWIFYTKADTTPAIRNELYNPSEDKYTIYYKKSANINELTSSPEELIAQSQYNRPEGFNQQRITAEYLNNKIYIIASSEDMTSDDSIYYYIYDPETSEWTTPTILISGNMVSNPQTPQSASYKIESASDENKIYITASNGNEAYFAEWNGEPISEETNPLNITTLYECQTNQPANDLTIMIINENIYFAGYKNDSGAKIYFFEYYQGCLSEKSSAIDSFENYYPEIFYDQEERVNMIYSYLDTDAHLLKISYSEDLGETWGMQKKITEGRYDLNNDESYSQDETWRDIMPEMIYDSLNGKKYLFYASEMKNNERSDSEIVFLEMKWDSENDHYTSLQDAFYDSNDFDTINAYEGLYVETLHTGKAMYLYGHNATLISRNPESEEAALTLETSIGNSVTIKGMRFVNSTYGIRIPAGFETESITLKNNSFIGHLDSGIINEDVAYLDARLNYWGDETGPGGFLQGNGDSISGNIQYSPWMTDETFQEKQYTPVIEASEYLDAYFSEMGTTIDANLRKMMLFKNLHGALINWVSNDTQAISHNGWIRHSTEEKSVKMTAYISFGDSKHFSREIIFTIPQDFEENSESVQSAADFLTLENLGITQPVSEDIFLPREWNNFTIIKWNSSNNEIIEIDEDNSQGHIYTPSQDHQIILSAEITKNDATQTKHFNITVSGYDYEDRIIMNEIKKNLSLNMVLDGNFISSAEPMQSAESVDSAESFSKLLMHNNTILYDLQHSTINDTPAGFDIVWYSSDNSLISPLTQEQEIFIFTESNMFRDTFSDEAYIYRDYNQLAQWGDYGPLVGENIEFSCGPCSTATFDDTITDLNEYSEFCGFEINTITSIITNDLKICARNVQTRMKYTIDMLSYTEENDCYDDEDGMCESSGFRTSYVKEGFLKTGEPNRQINSSETVNITAKIIGEERNITKIFRIHIPLKTAPSSAREGIATIYHDTNEILFDESNIGSITKINIPQYIKSNSTIVLNFYNLTKETNELYLENGLEILREYDSLTIPAETTLYQEDWNGIFLVQSDMQTSDYILSDDEMINQEDTEEISNYTILKVIYVGGYRRINLSIPATITFQGMNGERAAYVESLGDTVLSIIDECENENPQADKECYYYDGDDLKIKTYHFSIFAVLNVTLLEENPETESAASQNNRRGSSGYTMLSDECAQEWDCGEWTECSDGYRTRECIDKNNCESISGLQNSNIPETSEKCVLNDDFNLTNELKNPLTQSPDALFDILVDVIQEPDATSDLISKITLINFGGGTLIDANLTYTIKDSEGLVVYEERETTLVNAQKQFMKNINLSNLKDGQYYLNIDLTYPGQVQVARAEKNFVIRNNNYDYLTFAMLLLIVGLLILIYHAYRSHKNKKQSLENATIEDSQSIKIENMKKDNVKITNNKTESLQAKNNNKETGEDKETYKNNKKTYKDKEKNDDGEKDNNKEKETASKNTSEKIATNNSLLRESPKEKAFFIKDKNFRTVQELASEIYEMDDNTFKQYVNEQKNDFSNWIKDVFLRNDVAEKIRNIKNPKDLALELKNYS